MSQKPAVIWRMRRVLPAQVPPSTKQPVLSAARQAEAEGAINPAILLFLAGKGIDVEHLGCVQGPAREQHELMDRMDPAIAREGDIGELGRAIAADTLPAETRKLDIWRKLRHELEDNAPAIAAAMRGAVAGAIDVRVELTQKTEAFDVQAVAEDVALIGNLADEIGHMIERQRIGRIEA